MHPPQQLPLDFSVPAAVVPPPACAPQQAAPSATVVALHEVRARRERERRQAEWAEIHAAISDSVRHVNLRRVRPRPAGLDPR